MSQGAAKPARVYLWKVRDWTVPAVIEKGFAHLLAESGLIGGLIRGYGESESSRRRPQGRLPDPLVGIKLTYGETGNRGHVDARYVRVIAEAVRAAGGKPFLTETNTLYRGRRTNSVDHLLLAHEHGYSVEAAGAPLIPGDGLLSRDAFDVSLRCTPEAKHFTTAKLAPVVRDMDALVGLAHMTAHLGEGFGAAIKNIGMGLATRAGKLAQHALVKPQIIAERCTACGVCMDWCPAGAIHRVRGDGGAHAGANGRGEQASPIRSEDLAPCTIDPERCIGCCDCIVACRFCAVRIAWTDAYDALEERTVEYAVAVVQALEGRIAFVNFLNYITPECDCMTGAQKPVAPDIGIAASADPVALDRASCDLVIEGAGRDIFREAHPAVDWTTQLRYAAEIGLGTERYEIIEIPVGARFR